MALSGDLKDFGLLQLLTLIQVTSKTGSLSVQSNGQTAAIHFQNGQLTRVKIADARSAGLAAALYRAGRIDQEQYEQISGQVIPSEKALVLLLEDQSGISRDEIMEFVREKSVSDLFTLLTWPAGGFQMNVEADLSDDDIVVPTDLAPILEKARGFVQEWQHLTAYIPDLDRPLRLVVEPRQGAQDVCMGISEWRMVASLARELPLRELGRKLKLEDLEVRQVAYRLMSAGLAEVVEPQMVVPPTPSVEPILEDRKEKSGGLSRWFGGGRHK